MLNTIMDKLGKLIFRALPALLLTATLAGCREEPLPVAGDAIRFSVSPAPDVSILTKAGSDDPSVQTDLIKRDSKVKLYGSYPGLSTALFDGVDLTCTDVSAEGSTWSYGTPVRYWDKRYDYDFRAVFPTTADIQSGSNSASVVINYGTADGNGDYDLMVASAPAVVARDQIGTPVQLTFLHACSAVRFQFRDETVVEPAEGDPTYNYTLQSFKLTGLHKGGTLTYAGDSSAAGATVSGWSPDDTPSDMFSWTAGTETWPVPKDYAVFGGCHYVVPQGLDGAKLVFTYQVGAEVMPISLDLKIGDGTGTGDVVAWEPGKTYTYKLTILAHSIDFSVSCEDWTKEEVEIGPIG